MAIPRFTTAKDLCDTIGPKPVSVYRNLHKRCYSVRSMETGLVIAHADEVTLEECAFVVSEKGRARVLKEKRKNVHAFARGTLAYNGLAWCQHFISYNPYKQGCFVAKHTATGEEVPCFSADYVQMTAAGIKARLHISC